MHAVYEQRLGAGSQLRVGLVAFAFLAPVFIGVAIGIGRLEVIGFAFAWSALLALAAAQSRRAVFKVELVGDRDVDSHLLENARGPPR